jgi:hypothetical protein
MRFAAGTLLSLILAATALAATPPLGRAVPVSVPGYGPTISEKWMSDIATDGDSYFVVWNDRRQSPSYHIYGTRVSADGQVLDPTGIPFGRGDDPSVTATGHGYALAWHSYDGYYAATYENGAVRGVRLGDLNGECVGTKVASNGNTILVATCGRDVFLLDRQLHVLKQMKLVTRMRNGSGVAVTALGDEYLITVISSDYPYPVVTQKVDAAGDLRAAKTVAGSQGSDSVDIASNGSEALAVWRERSNLVGRVIARDQSSGESRTVGTADVTLPHPDRALYSPAVAWRGGEYAMMYMRGGYERPTEMFLARLDAAGVQVGAPVLITNDVRAHDWPDIAVKSDGSGAAAWLDHGKRSVRVGFFDSASIGSATPFHRIIDAASGAHEQLLPAMERVGGQPITAWLDRSIGTSDVRLARPGTAPLLVASNTDAQWLDVAVDGSTVWVAWFGNGKLGVRRYTAALTPIDAEPRLFAPPAGASVAVALAAGDGALAVVWRTAPLDSSAADLVASVLRADGTTREVVISAETEGAEDDTVAVWDGTHFFVAWRYNVNDMGDPPFPRPAPIRGLHVTSAGEVVEGAPIQLHVADNFTRDLKAAPSPQGVVLAWIELASNGGGIVTRVARYTGATPLVPSAPLADHGALADIAPLANGEVDIYWWTHDFQTATIRYERLSAALESQGDLFTTQPFPVSHQTVELAATVAGTLPVVVHTQVDDSAQATGISRLFVRQAPVPRRRAVR